MSTAEDDVPGVAAQAVGLARSMFRSNLRLAFVGGSYARGTATQTSDVDVFVVLRRPDMRAELRFAAALRDLHDRAGLSFDHCGELFDQVTLETLLTATDRCVTQLPAIQQMACYQADCLLSIFRKGDIVFKFLADPMICVVGDTTYLAALRRRAEVFFQRFPMRRVQRLKGRLALPADSPQSRLLAALIANTADDHWPDTPVGVGLHRWFGGIDIAPSGSEPELPVNNTPSGHCPLPSHPPGTKAGAVLRQQCLSYRTQSHHVRRGVMS